MPKEFSGFMSPFPLLIIPFLSKENKGKGCSNFAVVSLWKPCVLGQDVSSWDHRAQSSVLTIQNLPG